MMDSVPLPPLHIGRAALDAGAPDLRAVAIALAAFAVAAVLIWVPALPSGAVLRRRVWLSLGKKFVVVMVALAVLPAVLPYDHLFAPAHADGGADAAVHASHCHASPGTCSDAPLASGLGQFLFSEPLVVAPAMLTLVLLAVGVTLHGVYRRPETPPPMLRASV